MLEQFYDFSARLLELDQKAMGLCRPEFEKIDAIRDYNQSAAAPTAMPLNGSS